MRTFAHMCVCVGGGAIQKHNLHTRSLPHFKVSSLDFKPLKIVKCLDQKGRRVFKSIGQSDRFLLIPTVYKYSTTDKETGEPKESYQSQNLQLLINS